MLSFFSPINGGHDDGRQEGQHKAPYTACDSPDGKIGTVDKTRRQPITDDKTQTGNMNAESNKRLMQEIFAGLSKGNDQLFIDAMADEFQWHWMGSGQWSKIFNGKSSVLNELWAAVRTTLVPPYKVHAHRFLADAECVAIEASGENTTPDGKTYNNNYCWVCFLKDGKLVELHEYMDTDLVTRTFH
jgi:ketosteroid isomerase-like protein